MGKDAISEQSFCILLAISINLKLFYVKLHMVIPRGTMKKITLKYIVNKTRSKKAFK